MGMPTFAFYPTLNAPNAITRAYPAVLTLVMSVNYVVDEMIKIKCPRTCGMRQIDNVTARVIAVDAVANTITLDVDSSNFDAFVFVVTSQYPLTVPAGEVNTLAAAIRDNTARSGYVRV